MYMYNKTLQEQKFYLKMYTFYLDNKKYFFTASNSQGNKTYLKTIKKKKKLQSLIA